MLFKQAFRVVWKQINIIAAFFQSVYPFPHICSGYMHIFTVFHKKWNCFCIIWVLFAISIFYFFIRHSSQVENMPQIITVIKQLIAYSFGIIFVQAIILKHSFRAIFQKHIAHIKNYIFIFFHISEIAYIIIVYTFINMV